MATQTATQRKATAQKAAATRRRNAAKRSQSARKAAETRAQAELNTLQVVQAQAERAVLIPVGAALVARDAVVDAYKPYVEGRESAEQELTGLQKRVGTSLRKFERRGRRPATARSARSSAPAPAWSASCVSAAPRPCARSSANRREVEKQVKAARREAEKQAETHCVVARRVARLGSA